MPEPASKNSFASSRMPDRPARIGNFRSSAAQFLAALILMLVVTPFVDEMEYGPTIDALLFTLVLILGVLAVGRSQRTLVLAILLMVPAVLARWSSHFQPGWLPVESASALVFIGFVEYQLLHFILRAPRVNSEVLCAGISGYLLLGIFWMMGYMLVSRLNPDAFSINIGKAATGSFKTFDAYYFSFITLSTVGYGDITPLSRAARALAMTEAMTGTLYIAVLISRLVALYSSQGIRSPKSGDQV
jgi:hypothetical protein